MTEKEAKNSDEDKKSDDEQEPEPEKKKRIVKTRPKFEAEMLINEQTGLDALLASFERLNPDKIGRYDAQALDKVMTIYQRWFYKMFPGDFYDMTKKIETTKGAKARVREYLARKKGIEDFIVDEQKDDDLDEIFVRPNTESEVNAEKAIESTENLPKHVDQPSSQQETMNHPDEPPEEYEIIEEEPEEDDYMNIPEIMDLIGPK